MGGWVGDDAVVGAGAIGHDSLLEVVVRFAVNLFEVFFGVVVYKNFFLQATTLTIMSILPTLGPREA